MSEKNLNDTSTELSTEDKTRAIAAGINALLAFKLRDFSEEDNGDAYSACLSTMALLVRVFEGEDEAKSMLDMYTNGAYSKMNGLVDAGVKPEDAAKAAAGETDVH